MGSGSLFFFYKAIGMRAHVDFMRAWPDTRSGERKQPLCSTISRHLALVWRLQKKAFGILTNNSQQSNTESLFPFNFLWLKQFSNKKEPVDPKSSAFKKKLLLIIVKNYVCTFSLLLLSCIIPFVALAFLCYLIRFSPCFLSRSLLTLSAPSSFLSSRLHLFTRK